MFNPNCLRGGYHASTVPQGRQFLGANSVTNIELNNGVMPVPYVKKCIGLEKCRYRSSKRTA
jgi:hypothetical protein